MSSLSAALANDRILRVVNEPGYQEPKSVSKAKNLSQKLQTASAPIPTPESKAMSMLMLMHTIRPSNQRILNVFKCQMEHYCDSCRTFHKCVQSFTTESDSYQH